MATWTSKQDIIDRWVGVNVPTDEDLIDTLIDDAEVVIKSVYPRIQERLDKGTLTVDVIKFVVSRMVIRVLRNPENLGSHQMGTGPFTETRTYRGVSDIWLSDDEKNMLSPNNSRKAGSISLLDGSRKAYDEAALTVSNIEDYIDPEVFELEETSVDSSDAGHDWNESLEERDNLG